MIPNEAVEAAARALYGGSEIWEQEAYQEAMRTDARRALEAAAPHLMATAWHEGYDRAESDYYGTGFWATRLRDNPYRPANV